MGGTHRVNSSSGSLGTTFVFPENQTLESLHSTIPLADSSQAYTPHSSSHHLICSSSAGPISWGGLFSEKSTSLSQEILKKYFDREQNLESRPAFLNFFGPNLVYPFSEENLNRLIQSQSELKPYLSGISMGAKGDPSYQFSIQTEGPLKTPEGFEFPLTRIQFFKTKEGKDFSLPKSNSEPPQGFKNMEPTPPKFRGAQMSLLFIGGTLLTTIGMERLGVPDRVQGPLMLGAFIGGPTAFQFGLSQFGLANPVSWKGFGANLNAIGTNWSYFAPYQIGASILLDKTGIAGMGTKGNTYGSILLGASPFLAAKIFPRLGFLVGSPASLGPTTAGTSLATRGLGVVTRGFGRFIPIAGGVLIADTVAGWGIDLGEAMTGQDQDPSHKLYKFTRDLMMAKDFGTRSTGLMGRWMGLWADIGNTLGKIEDHIKDQPDQGGIESQASQFIQVSNEWGRSMRSVLIEIAFENTKEAKLDEEGMGKSLRDLYQGPHSKDIENAYFLLTLTGHAAKEAQKIKDLIPSDGRFDRVAMNYYLKGIIQEELKKDFQGFMEERLLQFARQAFRRGPKGNWIDWAFFEKKVGDFYETQSEAMKEIYTSPKTGHSGQEIRHLISKDGVCRTIPALEEYLKGLLKKQKKVE